MDIIIHTNGFPVYQRVKNAVKAQVEKVYELPKGEPYLYLDKDKKPFVQRPNEQPVYCKRKAHVPFSALPQEEQAKIEARFILPDDKTNVQVDEFSRPFVDRSMCTMRKSFVQGSFHKHEMK